MVKTRGQAKKAEDVQHKPGFKTEAIPGEEDSTMARWPPPAPSSRRWRGPRGGRGGRAQDEAVDWADLPDWCLVRVFEYLSSDMHAVSA